jgi:hypothetical protein
MLTPLLIMDRGHWKIKRFIQLSKQGYGGGWTRLGWTALGWMISWKNQTFVKV